MSHKFELPEPWEHVETLPPEHQEKLEAVVGSTLTYSDLNDEDVEKIGDGIRPFSRKSWLVMGHRWNRLRNRETGETVLVRLQTFDGNKYEISSVIFPLDKIDSSVTGARLRDFPVAAISAAYSYDEEKGRANLRTFFALIGEAEKTDPLDTLPPADSSPLFAARVARQYRQLETDMPDTNTAKAMAELNGKPLPTVQRWIAQARKQGFLAPAVRGRKHG